MDIVEIGNRIHTARVLRNVTLDDIANDIGVAKSTIQRYEKGLISSPKIPVLHAIANSLQVNPAWIVLKSDDMFLKDVKTTNSKDTKEISKILENTELLLKQDGLMFDGEPAAAESIDSIISAMKIGMEMAKQNNKKYTPNKYKKDD